MATAGDVFHNPVTGAHAVVLLGADDTEGRYTACAVTLPGGARRAHPHVHPGLVEAVEVRCGEVAVVVDREERALGPGERLVVAPGVRHDLLNRGAADAEVVLEVWPGRRFELLAATLFGLAREGRTDEHGMPDPLQLAVIAREFAGEVRWCSPPRAVQALAFGLLAPLARLRGRQAVYPRHLRPCDRVEVPAWPERPAPRRHDAPARPPAAPVVAAA
ncbi:MAG TPA: cupin domain-containing protein [Baekduia sp.]|nr:cupin domain-containing protein [Baekduia sp.]